MAGHSVTNEVEPREVEEEAGKAGAEEEDTGAQIAPIIKLEEVAVTTGEEDEDVLLDMKSKLYRFDKDGNQWKERGVGTVKLLKHKETGKVRLVMRQAKTLKICANHLVLPSISLQEHAGNDKSCVWHATDFSDGELKEELFCIRLGSVERIDSAVASKALASNAKKFMEMVEEIAASQLKKSEEEERDADSAAELLKDLKVQDQKEDLKEEIKEELKEVKEEEKDEEKLETNSEERKGERPELAKLEEKEEEKPEGWEGKPEAKEDPVEPAVTETKEEA
eukprot:Gb_13361 [translate_table: standard]